MARWMPSCATAAICAALAAMPDEAGAHPPIFTDAESEERADELSKRGNALSREGRLAEAVDAYRSSFKISESYAVAANLGTLELKLARYRDSAEHLAFALRVSPFDAKPAVTAALRTALAYAKAHVGVLKIRVTVEGTDTVLDGRRLDGFDLGSEVYVEPGIHTITASRPGYAAARRVTDVRAGARVGVELALAPLPTLLGSTAVEPGPMPLAAVESAGAAHTPLLVVGASAATLGIAMGVIFTVAANGKASRVASLQDQPCGPASSCADIAGQRATQRAFAHTATGSFIAAGALVLGTTGLATWPRMIPALRARAAPVITAEWSGLVVEGDF